VKETPAIGVFHPDLANAGETFLESPEEYLKWFRKTKPRMPKDAPVVGVLLYRKHVITRQPYLGQLVHAMEEEGVVQYPFS
jgi:magnesium chelatase subunit H